MTDKELAVKAETAFRATTISYPEWRKRVAAGAYPDVTATKWWQGFDLLSKIGVVEPPVDPPPVGWPAPPVPPITTVTNAPGLGKNYTTLVNASDLIVDGTGDTAVLFQPGAKGSSLKRARLLRCAIGNSVSYGKHAIYAKAPNLLIEDVYAECASPCASGFSLRYDGAVLRRSEVHGAPHAITYYETSTKAGAVLVEDVRGSFRGDTGIWAALDSAPKVLQAFTFRRVDLTGPGAFMKATAFSGSVRVENCTLNGKPVTAADLPGVPNVVIVGAAP